MQSVCIRGKKFYEHSLSNRRLWPEYLKSLGKGQAWLRVDRLMGEYRIAARLGMGTAGYVNNRLYRWRKGMLA